MPVVVVVVVVLLSLFLGDLRLILIVVNVVVATAGRIVCLSASPFVDLTIAVGDELTVFTDQLIG